MSERITKQQLKHDRFLELVQEGLAYARENALVVAGGVVAFIAVIALGVRVAGTAAGPRTDNPDAQRALAAARTEFALGRMDAGREALMQVTKSWRNSQAGREAMYILGNTYYEAGDWAKARESFEKFLEKPLYDDLMLDGARMGVAACMEESGDTAAAMDAYRALADGARHVATRVQAGLAAARCARALGRTDEARALYRTVVDRYPEAPEAEQARFALQGLGA